MVDDFDPSNTQHIVRLPLGNGVSLDLFIYAPFDATADELERIGRDALAGIARGDWL